MSDSGYRYVCEIARGGLGRVSLVMKQDGDFRRLYAMKRLLASHADDQDLKDMFRDEARIAGLLRHPNVVSVLDVGEDDEGPYLLMEYVEGVALTEIVRRARQLGELIPIQVCCAILKQVADGLHAAHELLGIDGDPLDLVHRDVSPSNVLVELNGHVRVTDFGIAKAAGRRTRTSTGMLKGKLGYIAPEMLRFEKPDRRADIFSLGVVLYELVTSERLYRGKEMETVAQRIINEAPPDLGESRRGVPDALVELCFEMLGKDPALRPSTAAEVSRRLGGVLLERVEVEGSVDVAEWIAEHIDESVLDERRVLGSKVARSRIGSDPRADSEPPGNTKRVAGARRLWRALAFVGTVFVLGGFATWSLYGSAASAGDEAVSADSLDLGGADKAPNVESEIGMDAPSAIDPTPAAEPVTLQEVPVDPDEGGVESNEADEPAPSRRSRRRRVRPSKMESAGPWEW